jgi:peptide deformylase
MIYLHHKHSILFQNYFEQEGFKTIINTMKSVMHKYDAAGLSAPQIGAPLRIVAIQITEKQLSCWSDDAIVKKRMKQIPLKFFINPTIKVVENEQILDREGL